MKSARLKLGAAALAVLLSGLDGGTQDLQYMSFSKKYEDYYQFVPGIPSSDFIVNGKELSTQAHEPDISFCAQWNPEFVFSGHRCCRVFQRGRRVLRQQCAPGRRRFSLCSEMTPEQKAYIEDGKRRDERDGGQDVLNQIAQEMGKKGDQAICNSTNGFLAWGRPIVPSRSNRVVITKPERCTQFGTDGLVGLIEWLGRRIHKQYNDTKTQHVSLMLGDLSGPRGGCLPGFSGRRGHTSHTNGLDADIGFLSLNEVNNVSKRFAPSFEPLPNLWLLKQVFSNPFACVKVVFLDRRHIRKLDKYARKHGEWEEWHKIRRFVRHMRGHRHHLHIRVGDGPGMPGCASDPRPEDEYEIDLSEGPELGPDATPESGSDAGAD